MLSLWYLRLIPTKLIYQSITPVRVTMSAASNPIDYEQLGKTISSLLDFVLGYAEFIISKKPYEKDNMTISEVRIFQKKIEAARSKTLTSEETEKYQNELLPIILYWNKEISKQVVDFYNAHADLGGLLESQSQLEAHNPITDILQRREKFLMANQMLNETFTKINYKYIDKSDLYAVFYSLIAAIEVTEYELYSPFNEALKKYKLDSKYDIENIFSVTTKRKNRYGNFQSDARMIRNALAHINYDLEMRDDSFTLSLYSGTSDAMQDMILTDVEFFKYVQNHKFLLQSFVSILMLMAAFSTMRHYYVKSGS
jgi:hypothetical protein